MGTECAICGASTSTPRSRTCANEACRRTILNQDQKEFQRRYRERTGKSYRRRFPDRRSRECVSCTMPFACSRGQIYCTDCHSVALRASIDAATAARVRHRIERKLPVLYEGAPSAYLAQLRATRVATPRVGFQPIWKACACKVCGARFLSTQFHATCSVDCAQEHRRNIRSGAKAVRRARERSARVPGEYVNRTRVFKRDNYMCGLCGTQTVIGGDDPQLEPTVDHRIPVSKGGKHTYANCQTAHRICNSWKCDADATTFLPAPSQAR